MKTKKNQKLSDYTTIAIGGNVPEVYLPANENELSDLLSMFHRERIRYRILGNGSNVLADDRGLDEVVVCTRSMERLLEIQDDRVLVDAGCSVAQLAYQTASRGLSGLEFAVGIPGSIGGITRMNAGAHGETIGEVVESVRLVLRDGRILTVHHDELRFGYRFSAIAPDAIVTAVCLRLTKDDRQAVHDRIRAYNRQRVESQPLREKSAGCIFRNPGGSASAGKLIDQSGLKGFHVGGAYVSEVHANFIVNRKNATFEDVLALIDHIKKTVLKERDVQLEEEVVIWRRE